MIMTLHIGMKVFKPYGPHKLNMALNPSGHAAKLVNSPGQRLSPLAPRCCAPPACEPHRPGASSSPFFPLLLRLFVISTLSVGVR